MVGHFISVFPIYMSLGHILKVGPTRCRGDIWWYSQTSGDSWQGASASSHRGKHRGATKNFRHKKKQRLSHFITSLNISTKPDCEKWLLAKPAALNGHDLKSVPFHIYNWRKYSKAMSIKALLNASQMSSIVVTESDVPLACTRFASPALTPHHQHTPTPPCSSRSLQWLTIIAVIFLLSCQSCFLFFFGQSIWLHTKKNWVSFWCRQC